MIDYHPFGCRCRECRPVGPGQKSSLQTTLADLAIVMVAGLLGAGAISIALYFIGPITAN